MLSLCEIDNDTKSINTFCWQSTESFNIKATRSGKNPVATYRRLNNVTTHKVTDLFQSYLAQL